MKINHFITTISRGGAENQLLILVKEQVKLGHTVTVYPLKCSLDLEVDFRKTGADVNLELHGKNIFTQLVKVYRMTFSNDEIVHAHLPQAEIVTHVIRSKNKLNSRHFGGKFFPAAPKILSSWISRLVTRNKTIIAISQFVSNYLIVSREVEFPTQIKVVKYGFDANAFLDSSGKFSSDKNDPNILVCGTLSRLSKEKDLETLIRGIYEFKRIDNQKITLSIFGQGIEEKNLIRLVKELNLTSQVTFHGKVENSARALTTLDIFILTSLFEGFGMVLLEAMATHRPIISSETPTAREVLGTQGAASFFEVGNPRDLALQIIQSKRKVPTDFIEAQKTQLKKFDSLTMAKRMEKIYLEVLGD